MKKAKPKIPPVDQRISIGEVYSRDAFMARTGLGAAALKAAKKSGLRTVTIGNRLFVTGDAWLAFVEAKGGAE